MWTQKPQDHSHSVRHPPNHITAIGKRYVVKALESDIFGLVAPLSTEDVLLLTLGVFVSISTRGGISLLGTIGGGGFGASGTGSGSSYPEPSSLKPSSSSVIGSSSTLSPDPLPDPYHVSSAKLRFC